MPKVKWEAADSDNALTADDIETAEDNGFEPYMGEVPRGGVYRFRLKRGKRVEFGTGNQGINFLFELDGSWKPEHAEFDGCPLWDRVVMTKSAAAFVKAFAAAYGVTAADMVGRVVMDDEDRVTKIGNKVLGDGDRMYINVKRGKWNDEARLEKSGTGYLVVEEDAKPAKKAGKALPVAEEEAAPAGKVKKGKKAKAAVAEEEAPF